MVGKIKRVGLREVWKHEAKDFTTWLEENIDVLNEVIDLELTSAEREKSVGTFNVDLVAEDNSGKLVIIENQLEKSNHDHLGKVITYLTNLEATAAIWIVKDPRPEHVRAISWLNESSSSSFYLIKLEAIKIGESESAPLLTLIVGPSEEGKQIGTTKKGLAKRHVSRKMFWEKLLDYAKTKTKLHSSRSASISNTISSRAGKSGLSYCYVITKNDASVELYIDRGKDSEKENEKIFNALARKSKSIDRAFGNPLDWQRLEGKRACRIKFAIGAGGREDEEKWPEIQKVMVDSMVRLEKVLRPHIKRLKI